MKLILCTAALLAAFTIRPAAAPLPADHAWSIDGVHSSVMFKIKHASSTWFYGSFAGITGGFTLDAGRVPFRIQRWMRRPLHRGWAMHP